MKTLETNDWVLLNDIIYKVYTTEDSRKMREQFLEQMKMMLDFDGAGFYLASLDGAGILTNPVLFHWDEDCSGLYGKLDYVKSIVHSGKSLVFRETDIVSDEKRMESSFYKKVCIPNNWHYSLHLMLGRNKEFLGAVTFYRTIGKENFQYDDIFLMDLLKEHLAYRLYRDRREQGGVLEKLTVTQAAETYGLTKREQTILRMLLQGLDNSHLCQELSISVNTLKKHILNIYRKLGIKNRVQMFKMIKEKE